MVAVMGYPKYKEWMGETNKRGCIGLYKLDGILVEAETTYYGVIRNIFELDYISFKVVIFYCDWVKVEDKNACKVDQVTNLIMVDLSKLKSNNHVSDEPFVCAFQKVNQVFYLEYINNVLWSIV